jgi:hypothetical protein
MNTLSSISSLGIEEQIKREIAQASELLKLCAQKVRERAADRS